MNYKPTSKQQIRQASEQALTNWAKDVLDVCGTVGLSNSTALGMVSSMLAEQLVQLSVKTGMNDDVFLGIMGKQFKSFQKHIMTCDCDTCVEWREQQHNKGTVNLNQH